VSFLLFGAGTALALFRSRLVDARSGP
jgi:hypothetical protein